MHEMRQFPISTEMQECIDLCQRTHQSCVKTAIHCLQSNGRYETKDIRLLFDCAEICQTSANFLLRGSDMHTYTCAVCSEICDVCAQECARYSDDPMMEKCADICRRCFSSCHHMAGAMV